MTLMVLVRHMVKAATMPNRSQTKMPPIPTKTNKQNKKFPFPAKLSTGLVDGVSLERFELLIKHLHKKRLEWMYQSEKPQICPMYLSNFRFLNFDVLQLPFSFATWVPRKFSYIKRYFHRSMSNYVWFCLKIVWWAVKIPLMAKVFSSYMTGKTVASWKCIQFFP